MSLETIWFFIWGFFWAVFFMTDGFDFGVGVLYPFLGKNDEDKRVMINSLGPVWDGNEVWLIAAGAVTFAVFPVVYATMLSFLYSPLMLLLFALILRGVSFEFRGKINHSLWKTGWDFSIFIGSLLPALLFGVIFANLFKGLPFDAYGYHGTMLSLLNPYALIGGILFLFLFLQHGALWLCIKTEGALQSRAAAAANDIWYILFCLTLVFLVVSVRATDMYSNYLDNPALFTVLVLSAAALIGIKIFLILQKPVVAWFASALTILLILLTGLIGLFPRLLTSSLDEQYRLTVYDAAAGPLTLKIMLGVVIILMPVVVAYQTWSYFLFRGKVRVDDLTY